MKTAEELSLEVTEIANRIADEKGMNISYCESMDMDLFSMIAEILSGMEDGFYQDEIDPEDLTFELSDLQFYARNDRILPSELQDATLNEFFQYFKDNHNTLLKQLDEEMEPYRHNN